MRFRTYTKRGEISLDASIEERVALAEFIDTSLTSKQVDYDEHSPVDRAALRGLREIIAAQSAADSEPLIVPRGAFWELYGVASGWHFLAYNHSVESLQLDVPRVMVNAIRSLGGDLPRYVGLPDT